jgi:predicted deacylase
VGLEGDEHATPGGMSLAPYDDLPGVLRRLQALGPVHTYGSSVEGRPLWAVRVGASNDRRVLVTAAIHGIEYIGTRVALRLAESLADRPLAAEVWVAPVLNPDAYARTWRDGGAGSVGALRKNARGVDLNRNFPLPWGMRPSAIPLAGSSDPRAATFRGATPLSEPETRALAELVLRVEPQVSANLHSFMGTLIPARVTHRTEWAAYSRMLRGFRAGRGGVPFPRLGSLVGDVFTGELEDWQHHVVSCWAVCIELFPVLASLAQHLRAPDSFWRFNPREPGRTEARDAAGVHALLHAGLQERRPPSRAGSNTCLEAW